jgi:hypothetical protein
LASRGTCGLFGGAVSGYVVVLPVRRPVSFYSSGELSVPIFVRGIRRPLPLSPVARCRLLCAVRCSFGSRGCAVRVSVAVPLCRRRQLLAGALSCSCSADERHAWVRSTGIIGSPCGVLAVPRRLLLRALVPLTCQLRWFCSRCFVVDWPGSPGVPEVVAVVT